MKQLSRDSETAAFLAGHLTKRIRSLQFFLKARFGTKATSDAGECTLSIEPDRIELTDEEGTIVARGPARVATVLVRKRRRAAK